MICPKDFGHKYVKGLSSMLVVTLSTYSQDRLSASEVWIGWDHDIRRFSTDGVFLSSFYSEDQGVDAMTVVGDEVWIGWDADIRRFTKSGGFLGSFYSGDQYVSAMARVGEEVWVAWDSDIRRFSHDRIYLVGLLLKT